MSCERLRRVANARVPVCCVDGVDTSAADNDTVLCDIIVDGRGCVEAIVLKKEGKAVLGNGMVEEGKSNAHCRYCGESRSIVASNFTCWGREVANAVLFSYRAR